MRRILFLLIMGLSAIAGNAQENFLKFFEDGKSWICKGYNYETKEYYRFRVSVVGDTVVGGVTARKLQSEMVETGEKSTTYQVGYEAYGKVYIWLNNGFRVFFDFINLNVGQYICDFFGQPIIDEVGIKVSKSSVLDIEGIHRTTYSPQCCIMETGEECLGCHDWIEGIGEKDAEFLTSVSHLDPFWKYDSLEECYLYDRCIYRYDDSYPVVQTPSSPDLSSIEEIGNDEVNEAVYDLMGRKVTHPQPGHIYITPSGKRIY